MGEGVKATLLGMPGLSRGWQAWRRGQFLRDYRRRREAYERIVHARGLRYDPARSAAEARARLRTRGYEVRGATRGEIHTLAFVPRLGWHPTLLRQLSHLGPVSTFDYTQLGVAWQALHRGDVAARRSMNDAFCRFARDVNRQRAVDWVYVYATGIEISPGAIRQVQSEIGAPVVGMCLDDKNSWAGPVVDGYRTLQVDLAPVLDLAWTSARVACDWYLVEGGRPLYLPEGCEPEVFRPVPVEPDLDVSFVGQAYGFRPGFVRQLRRAGLRVRGFGRGWESGPLPLGDYVTLLSRSRINLGLGGVGYTPEITNVKGRDFEVPCAGGGVYLTTYNPDLALHFEVGREILCYRDVDEAIELIRYYLRQPEESRHVAARARERCLREHTWVHRYTAVLHALGVLAEAEDRGQAAGAGSVTA